MTNFTAKELNALLYFLEDYSAILGRRGRQDLPSNIKELFTPEEGSEITRKFNILNTGGHPERDSGPPWPIPDFCFLDYLVSKLNGAYEEYFGKQE